MPKIKPEEIILNSLRRIKGSYWQKYPDMRQLMFLNKNRFFRSAQCPFDIFGCLRGKFCAIEVKSSKNSSIRIAEDNIKKHQIEGLERVKQCSGLSFLFFEFSEKGYLFIMDINRFVRFRNMWKKKSISIKDFIELSTKNKCLKYKIEDKTYDLTGFWDYKLNDFLNS